MQSNTHRQPRAFTLVELLVVTLIISILLTVGSVAFKGAGGKGVTSALATTEALFDEARSIAVGKGTRARVLVDVDDVNSDTYLRRVVVAFEELDDEGNPVTNSWELVGRGYSLPDRTYFSRQYSKRNHEGGSGDLQEMTLVGVSGLYDGRYLYYEFNSEGICTTGLNNSGDYTGPSFVLGNGIRPKGQDPKTAGDGKRDFGGFVIWRNGSTSIFRSPDQILGGATPTTF
ncbi:pilus assembly FimT family protein [Haloferula rosea]|uniref:Type II secretion system protein n=1 Tax=Haloferula rosea TaxID=490093 RepID=A0A934VB34_9BACT|nr:type II secretion system protein [Haloferula rosea]MBK1826968.1 type II secretion system protein [Haloferula rosea]